MIYVVTIGTAVVFVTTSGPRLTRFLKDNPAISWVASVSKHRENEFGGTWIDVDVFLGRETDGY